IEPEREGIPAGYEQKLFPEDDRRGKLRLLVSPDAEDGALKIHQDARLYSAILTDGERVEHALVNGRGAWLQVARGSVDLNGTTLTAGDGAAIEDEPSLAITAHGGAEILLFDLGE